MHHASVHDDAMQHTDLIGSKQACQILDVDRATLIRMVRDGRLASKSKMPGPNGAYVFDRHAVEALAAERKAASAVAR